MHLLPGKRFTTLNTIYHADAMDLLRNLPDDSMNLIATDPPYFKVKAAAWDHQWDDTTAYLNWLDGILAECRRVLVPNGSLYMFASPQMAARVEMNVGKHFKVLNHIVWVKPSSRHNQASPDDIRSYFPQTERIIFAQQQEVIGTGLDQILNDQMLFADIRQYFWDERQKVAHMSYNEINSAMGLASNGGGMASNILNSLKINWTFPTKETYELLSLVTGVCKRPYDDLRREYEDLRREYEDLRRPFNSRADRPYTDVWTYKTVSAYEGKHECEKPLDMMKHIVEISSRPNDVVLDLFVGSGSTMDAARQTGRRWIGCDADKHWSDYANRRLEKPYNQMLPIFEEAA